MIKILDPPYDGWCTLLPTHQIYFLNISNIPQNISDVSQNISNISQLYLKFIANISQLYPKYISIISLLSLNYISIIYQSYLRHISIISNYISTIFQIHDKYISKMSQINLNYISQGLPPPGLPSATFLQHSMGGDAPLPQTHVPFVPLPEVTLLWNNNQW